MNRRNGSRDFGSNRIIIISDMAVITNMLKLNLIKERGNVTVATQSVTVEMYKTDLQQKI